MTQYNIELKELTRVLEHDRKLKSFMGIKSQDRSKARTRRSTLHHHRLQELERTGRMSMVRKVATPTDRVCGRAGVMHVTGSRRRSLRRRSSPLRRHLPRFATRRGYRRGRGSGGVWLTTAGD